MFTFGSDPEFMIVNDGKYYSAIGIIQGDAENRITVRGHQFYYDNVMAECAIKPGKTKREVIKNFRECLQIYAEMVRPYQLLPQAYQEYPLDQLEDPRARIAGCAKDCDAYTMEIKESPKEIIEETNMRSCGGHIHLGSEVIGDGADLYRTLYMLDLFVGIPSLWLDKDPTSINRRKLYGQAGSHRVTNYGVEYRSLGNFWLVSPDMVALIHDLCGFVLDFVKSGKATKWWLFDAEKFYASVHRADAWTCHDYDFVELCRCINTGDRTRAKKFMVKIRRLLPEGIVTELDRMTKIANGDFYENWQLDKI